jgi:carbonic anhydrase/acetyltransferase-like protein (isoleucine patch superfamily)
MPIFALGDLAPRIHPTAYIHPDAVVIGDVEIGEESSVWPGAVLRGDEGGIYVGARTSIQDGTVVHTTPASPTRVGDECVIGHNVHLEGCRIHDFALVGSGSVVLHMAEVHTGALVGAQALVPNRMIVPSKAMALGVPAKLREDAVTDEMIRGGVEHYVQRAIRYRKELRQVG